MMEQWEFLHRDEPGVFISAARAYHEAERRRSYICMHYSNRAIGYGAALLSGVGPLVRLDAQYCCLSKFLYE